MNLKIVVFTVLFAISAHAQMGPGAHAVPQSILRLGQLNQANQLNQPTAELINRKNFEKTFPLAQCGVLKSCGLNRIRVIETQLAVSQGAAAAQDRQVFTDFKFVLDFQTAQDIPQFGVVQWIRGCQYESELKANGRVEVAYTFVHKNLGRRRLVHYPAPAIDSESIDPLKSAFDGYDRFDLYRWNADPNTLTEDEADWYYYGEPPHGTVFLSEAIGTTGLIPNRPRPTARNSSLELENCVFAIADLPLEVSSNLQPIDKTKALHCHKWTHSFEYDFTRGRILATRPVSRRCDGPVGPQPP